MRRLSLLPGAAGAAATAARPAFINGSRRSLQVLITGGAALCALLLPVAHRPALRLVWNVSASVPVGLYRILPGAAPSRGDLVAVRPSLELAHYMTSRRDVEAGG